MINRTFSSVAVVIALGILTPIQANAFGLGKLELSSALNEPFNAKIPVTALREDEEGNLQVRLATSNEFARAGIERSHYLTKLVFSIVEHPGGAIIEVSSQQPIKEPFVDFLLTATTGEGRLIREYTVLLDPPKSVFARPAAIVTSSQVQPLTQKPSNNTTYQDPDSVYQDQVLTSNPYSGTSYGPTKRDDTLWHIAMATKPSSSVSVHQMMIALLDKNPNAFIKNNINNLKTSQTLAIPSMGEIVKLSNRQAIARVAEQWQQWKNANNKVSPTKVQAESNATGSNNQLPENGRKADASDDARLQLVVDTDDAARGGGELSPLGNDTITKLREQLTLAQETIEGQEQENIDFKSRMDAMEEQLEIMRRIIMVKDADLARLQGTLGDEEEVDLESEEMQQSLASDAIVDELLNETEELLENTDSSMHAPAERMVDEAAVEAAAAAAREEAEYNGNDIFTGADSTLEVLPEKIDFNSDTSTNDYSLQVERMVDEAAVAAAAKSAREEAELSDDHLFLNSGVNSNVTDVAPPINDFFDEINDSSSEVNDSSSEVNDSSSEVNDSSDEVEEVLPYPEINSAQELVVEDEGQLSLTDKIKAFILENKTTALAGLGILLLGLFSWLFVRRRNQDEEYEWINTDPVDGEVQSPNITAKLEDVINEEQMVSDASEILAAPAEDIDDLLAQAEMSIVYGEYEEAHAVVEQARIQDPTSQAVTLKLVALAYHQKQPEEFSKLIADINLDKDSAEWQEIITWGNELLPLVEEVADGPNVTEDLTDTLTIQEPETIEVNEESDRVLEFNLDEPLEDAAEENSKDEQGLSLDFDLEEGSTNSNNDNDLDLETLLPLDIEDDDSYELTLESNSLENTADLVLDPPADLPELSNGDTLVDDEIVTESIEEDIPELTSETTIEEVEELDIGADDLEFDIGDFDEIDEAETKLDLAAAYVDMGDPDGARNILNEVLQEGNDEQKSRAQDLLTSLA